MELILDLVPKRRLLKSALHELIHFASKAMDARRPCNVFIDTLWEGVWLLEHHANSVADLYRVNVPGVDILSFEQDLSLDGCAGVKLIHAIQGAQQRRFAAP